MITKVEVYKNLKKLLGAQWDDDTENDIVAAFEDYYEESGETFIVVSDLNQQTWIDDIKCHKYQAYATNASNDNGFVIYISNNKIVEIEEI